MFKLETERLWLRDFTAADREALLQIVAAPDYQRYYSEQDCQPENYQRLLNQFIQEAQQSPRQAFHLALEHKTSGQLIGMVSLRLEQEGQACCGFGLSCDLQGQGLMREAANRLIDFGFSHLSIQRLSAETLSENQPAINLCLSLGMTADTQNQPPVYFKQRWWHRQRMNLNKSAWQQSREQTVHLKKERQLSRQTAVYLFDWGNTLMVDDPRQTSKMYLWPELNVVPGAQKLLAELANTHAIYLATNAADSNQDDIRLAFERVGLAQYMSGYFCRDNLGLAKGSAEFYRKIVARLNVPPGNVTMVGDQYQMDILPAVEAGLQAVWLSNEQNTQPLPVGVTRIHSLTELCSA